MTGFDKELSASRTLFFRKAGRRGAHHLLLFLEAQLTLHLESRVLLEIGPACADRGRTRDVRIHRAARPLKEH